MLPDPRVLLARRVYYGWVIVFGCLLMTMVVFGTSYAFGVFYDVFNREFAVSRSVLALVFGVQAAFIYVIGVPAGWLVDRYGQRRVIAGSTVVLTVGLLWTAFARSYIELVLAFGVITAIGMAGLYVIAYATVSLWFERRRGAAAGIASSGLGVGLVVIPQAADRLISVAGWRTAMLAMAVGAFATMALVTFLFVDTPETVGADTSIEFDTNTHSDDDVSQPADRSTADTSSRDVILSPAFALVFVGWVLLFVPVYVVLTHVVVYASEIEISRSIGVAAIGIVGVTTTATRLGVGTVSDRFGRTRTFLLCGGLLGVASFGLGGLELFESGSVRTAVFVGVTVLFGIAYGGSGGLVSPQVADLFGEQNLNTLFAAMSMSFAISGLVAPPLAGFVFETTGTYIPALVGAGTCAMLGTGFVLGAARRKAAAA